MKYTFKKCETDISHYYVFNTYFTTFWDAENYCDKNNIPYDFIVKTKFFIQE